MSFSVPDFDQRLLELQAQLDRLAHASPADPGQAEQRLSLLADQFTEILRRWSVVSERHTRASTKLESDLDEWTAAGVRLQDDIAKRLFDVEIRLEREWQNLRERYEAPVRQLHEDAASLTQVTIATANSAQQHFERSAARLSAIEEEFGRKLADLGRQIQAVSEDVRAAHAPPPPSPVEASADMASDSIPANDAETDIAGQPVLALADSQEVPEPSATDLVAQRLAALERAFADREADEASRAGVAVALPAVDALSERFASLERAFAEREVERVASQAPAASSAEQVLPERLASLERALAERETEREASRASLSTSLSALDRVSERLAAVERALEERASAHATASVSSSAVDALTARLGGLERILAERGTEMREASQQVAQALRAWRVAGALLAVLAVLAIASGVMAWRLRQDVRSVSERVDEAQRSSAITSTAARELATTRDAAARELEEAKEQTARARMIGEVLAAPDVIRYELAGREGLTGAVAQVRWSRSRGVVFSGSRIPAPPPEHSYQVWLLTRAGAVRTASFAPDESGAVTVAVPPPQTSGAVVGAMVTTEPAAGSDTPTGSEVLARADAIERTSNAASVPR